MVEGLEEVDAALGADRRSAPAPNTGRVPPDQDRQQGLFQRFL
jgi:hypothetical protein